MYILPKLPYSKTALAPFISSETIDFHYEKHHQTYVTNMNKIITDLDLNFKKIESDSDLLAILNHSVKTDNKGLFNNTAQVINHNFYWNSLNPDSTKPDANLNAAIQTSFGSMKEFQDSFALKSATLFGSGWVWLVKDQNDALSILPTCNADTPFSSDLFKPLFVLDVWEHAYYIDYRNKRVDYIAKFMELINWEFANKNFQN